MAVDRAQTGPEDVRSPAATDLADKVRAVPRPTDDLFDWYIVADKRGNCIMGVLTPRVALISQPFRSGQEGWIDRRSADCSANPTHGPTYGVKERRARVFHQMPTISHLDGVRDRPGRSLTVSAAAITRDDLDPRMLGKPSLHGGRFPVRQQRHDPPSLQITYDCP